MNPFFEKLQDQPLLCDGAMGTLLFAQGASVEQCLEELVLTQPDWIAQIHQAYASAGADVIKSHTFGANRVRLERHELVDKVRDINYRAVKLVRNVREMAGRALFIAGDVGPLGQRLQPTGPLDAEEAAAAFRAQISVLWEAGADLLLFETFSDLQELSIAVQTAKELCNLPIIAAMTFAEDGLTPGGLTPSTVVEHLLTLGADVAGANCSVGPAPMLHTLDGMHSAANNAPLLAMPNAGFPERVDRRFSHPASPDYFARHVVPFIERGARMMGGCCGTTSRHTRAMRSALDAYLVEQASQLRHGSV